MQYSRLETSWAIAEDSRENQLVVMETTLTDEAKPQKHVQLLKVDVVKIMGGGNGVD